MNYNAKALANTARGLIERLAKPRVTIASTINEWKTCVKQSGMKAPNVPAAAVTRKAALADFLRAMAVEFDALANRDAVFYGSMDESQRRAAVERAHVEALLANFGILASRYVSLYPDAVISPYEAHEQAIAMHNARYRIKPEAEPATLPREYLIDVLRAALRTTPASQEQIGRVASMTDDQLKSMLRTITGKGARITAHLIKSKQFGYGALTFGCDGHLPPGTYSAMTVLNMKNARNLATRYNAMMWNF